MKRLHIITLLLVCAIAATAKDKPHWHDRSLSDDNRIDLLIKELNTDEKLDLLMFGGVKRLGIRPHGAYEAIHGLVIGGPGNPKVTPQPTTAFPQGYGLGETWDKELLYQVGEQMSTEARALYNGADPDKRVGLVLWAPNADIGRDPRWGRTEECFGEDPTLVGALSAAMIRGMQGPDPNYWRAASLMKHFLANSNENERTRTSSDLSDRLWREYYSYGFYKGFIEGGGSSYMAAYNKLNGVPCTVHPMLKDIVADEWGVGGIVSTDGGAFGQLLTEHHYFDTREQAAAACIKNGVNQFLDRFREDAVGALEQGLITEADIDACLRGRLRVMLKLGLLDSPEDTANPYLGINGEPWYTPEARQLARRAADESVVLIKNDNHILPLDTLSIKRIAVIGNKADTVYADWYGGEPPYRVSPLRGIKAVAEPLGIEVRYVKDDRSGAAAEAARWADVVIACVGNHPVTSTDYDTVPPPWAASANMGEGREAIDRQSLQLDAEDLIRVAHKHNPRVVVALISSFPYAINWTASNIDGIVHCTQSAQELGNALADVLFGKYNPAGRLTQTWPKAIDDLPDIMDYDITHGRTYMYAPEPLFAFGHGLSYTDFAYDGLVVKRGDDCLKVEFGITNTGAMDGDEVPQVYVENPGDTARQRLKAFDRVHIKAGETRHIQMSIPLDDLRLWDESASEWYLPTGEYKIYVSTSSATPHLSTTVKI